jgi:hypothetical protein
MSPKGKVPKVSVALASLGPPVQGVRGAVWFPDFRGCGGDGVMMNVCDECRSLGPQSTCDCKDKGGKR